jgi:hypothetical protein
MIVKLMKENNYKVLIVVEAGKFLTWSVERNIPVALVRLGSGRVEAWRYNEIMLEGESEYTKTGEKNE